MPEVLNVFLSILGILAIVIAGAFVIVFVVDLLISIIDSKNGIFFKRNKEANKHKNENYDSMRSTNVVNQDAVSNFSEADVKPDDMSVYTSTIDYEAAEREKAELMKMKAEEEAYRNKNNKTESVFETKPEIYGAEPQTTANIMASEPLIREATSQAVAAEQEDWDFDFDNKEEVPEFKTKDDQIADILEEYEDILEKQNDIEEQEEEVFDFSFASEESNDTLSIVTDNISDKNEEIKAVEENLKLAQSEKEKQEALDQLNELLNEKEKLVRFAQDAKETLDELEKEREIAEEKLVAKDGEIEKLKAELAISREQKSIVTTKYITTDESGTSQEELEQRLMVLEDRLKANEKELKKVKKEYRPLESVRKSLESNRKKLLRKEAIVVRQDVLLYGVNNYVDIDDEKAKKLTEEHELLDGLRMSVRQCEEIIESSKERYPVLEQSYKILNRNNKELRDDIEAIKAELAGFTKKSNNDSDEE